MCGRDISSDILMFCGEVRTRNIKPMSVVRRIMKGDGIYRCNSTAVSIETSSGDRYLGRGENSSVSEISQPHKNTTKKYYHQNKNERSECTEILPPPFLEIQVLTPKTFLEDE